MSYDTLVLLWVVALGFASLGDGLLDGFDLGVGMLFGLAEDEEDRDALTATIAPSWDGNETWLLLIGTILFGAFSQIYAVLLSAFYIPILLMLFGLIFRGVAFEFRGHAGPGARALWNVGFWVGSGVVSFVQGAAVGTMIAGIPVVDRHFAGNSFIWLKPFPVLCGVGLMFGYAVLGACFLVARGPDELLARAVTWGRRAAIAMGVIVLVNAILALQLRPEAWQNLLARPWAFEVAAVWVVLVVGLVVSLTRASRGGAPFLLAALSFVCAFLVLAAAFWPYMIPGAVTIAEAASPESSLRFLFWGGGLFALPIIILYTIVVYRVFKVGSVAAYESES